MKRQKNNFALCSLLFAHCQLLFADCAFAQSSTPFSQYGQIQNVQNYSSNPFWNPNGPYNQRMPQVIYADGPEINAGDCQRVVSGLVANICATMNNCVGTQISDVRPTLMLRLSQIPGHNYATSCAGYIDTEYEAYLKNYGHAGTSSGVVAFPDDPVPVRHSTPAVAKNPMAQQLPQWKQDIIERTNELKNLQAQNSNGSDNLAKADFPETFNDLSYQQQIDYLQKGYEPYKGKSAYATMDIDSMDAYNESGLNPMSSESNKNSSSNCTSGSTFTVTYQCGNGSGNPVTQTVICNQSYKTQKSDICTPPSNQPFKHWAISGGGTIGANESITWKYNTDKTFTAKYTPTQPEGDETEVEDMNEGQDDDDNGTIDGAGTEVDLSQ